MKPRWSLPLTFALCALVAALALLGLRTIGLESVAPVSGVARAVSPSREGNAKATSRETFHALADHRASAYSETASAAAASADAEDLPSLADLLEAEQGDLSDPAVRERVVGRLREIEQTRRAAAEREAASRGLPVRVERAGGVVQELVAFENGQPVYFTTHNLDAAISSGASALRAAPYNLTGAGIKVGVWDGGSVRASHQEFAAGSRVTVKDGSVSIDHATHVAGTIAGAGVVASARGMATAAGIDSYDWNSDKAEMTARAAAAPGQPDALYLSNHSYGYISGWNYVAGGSPSRVWEWHGNGTNAAAAELDFGRYNVFARDSDALAAGAPYFLMVRSAGNDRVDNPSVGQLVALAPGSTTVVAYDPALHPGGDGGYRGGFETIGYDALAKNVLTVGSVTDAVLNGVRDPSRANASVFSSFGPTDDGRIKPDLVANGDGVYSSLNGSDAAYGTLSGTSMATPNAVGTAALLIEEYARLFPGGAMRSSTLKGLLIHTADDRGLAGPDYKFGWGLINGQAAVDLLRDHAAHALKSRLVEGLLDGASTTRTHEFVWDGTSAIRATLAWTDPAGTDTTTADLRTPRLRNNLEVKVVAPDGSEHLPFVMPFVGTWTQASMDLPATKGRNNTDNVEQVHIAAPPAPGAYRIVVSYAGTLVNNQQVYSLLLSGSADVAPPPPPLQVAGVSPASALPGAVVMDLTGTGFKAGAAVRLVRAGQTDRVAGSVTLVGESLRAEIDLTGAAPGKWDVRVQNPDGETFTLAEAFTVVGALWSETFDGVVSGWTQTKDTGNGDWTLGQVSSHTPARAYFIAGPAAKTTTSLVSPLFTVPAGATNLQFKFWHRYELQSGRDGGRLEFSVAGGPWFNVTATGSGASFASNGYNATLANTGNPNLRSDFAGGAAWSGNSGGYVETIVNLTDTAKFAGKTLRARWRLATDGNTASTGWYVDTISLLGGGDLSNAAPVIVTPAATASAESATDADGTVFAIVRGREIGVSVGASDDGGAAALTYTWSAASASGAPVGFLPNGTNAARLATAYFEAAGDYVLSVTVRDAQGLATTGGVAVRVIATADAIRVTPEVASVVYGGAQTFTAAVLDQFGAATAVQPSAFNWSASGGGTIDASGRFGAIAAGGPFTVTATSGALSGQASVTVNRAVATITLGGLEQTFDGTPRPVTWSTSPAGLAVTVTYDGGMVVPNAPGEYRVVAEVTDPNHQGVANGTLVIRTGFAAWVDGQGTGTPAEAESAAAADEDGDGLPALLEYALGLDPEVQGSSPVAVEIAPQGGLSLTFPSIADPGLVYTVEVADDPAGPWRTLNVPGNPISGGAVAAGTHTVTDSEPADGRPRRFLRLRVAY